MIIKSKLYGDIIDYTWLTNLITDVFNYYNGKNKCAEKNNRLKRRIGLLPILFIFLHFKYIIHYDIIYMTL